MLVAIVEDTLMHARLIVRELIIALQLPPDVIGVEQRHSAGFFQPRVFRGRPLSVHRPTRFVAELN